jgi:hypothetical protein
MTKYLLAAEADRIQDLLFRSSQLREVVGGSQILKRFSEEVPAALIANLGLEIDRDIDIITAKGGSFYLEFSQRDTAKRFGQLLAEAYHRASGGTLSVIEPVEYSGNEQDYPPTSEKAGFRLRAVKRRGSFRTVTQFPYVAFCESCGIGLAEAHEQPSTDENEEGHYLCAACRAKAAERVDQSLGRFLKPFYAKIVEPNLLDERMEWPEDADSVGQLDPRNYVAYIVADGNGMGQVFRHCTKSQARLLSEKMDEVLQDSLAAAIKLFLQEPAGNSLQQFIPTLPLIMGGDDLFALVPARWSLDIAGRLCQNFQTEMTRLGQEIGVLAPSQAITMTAAVVICKANYPYYLAHEIGEKHLSESKRVVKALARDENLNLSAVDFEVILGSQIAAASRDQTGGYRPTLRPYWVVESSAPPPREWGLLLHDLLEHRLTLAQYRLPVGRRSQLRELLDRASQQTDTTQWNQALGRMLERMERDRRWQNQHPLRLALEALGGAHLETWTEINRSSGQHWQGNGMGDLLRIWDWALRIDEDPTDYEGGQA